MSSKYQVISIKTVDCSRKFAANASCTSELVRRDKWQVSDFMRWQCLFSSGISFYFGTRWESETRINAFAQVSKRARLGFKTCASVCLFVFIFFVSFLHAQPKLSDKASISLITCSPGKEVYEAFGHSAIRVFDPANRMDIIYNYGTFDFEQENFAINYAKGRPIFMLDVNSTKRFIEAYVYHNRSVYQDILNLTPEQNQRLFELLQENARPENCDYRYDYIYDNCSSRIRDIVRKVLEGNVVFDSSHITQSYSFRELMDLYLEPQPWGDLGIDLALGSEIDKKARPYEYMFLPDYLRSGFLNAMNTSGSEPVGLVKSSNVIFEAAPEDSPKSLLTPLNVFLLLFVLVLLKTILDFRKEKISFLVFDVLLFILIGIVGIVMTYISFFSDHHAKGNYNLLWALPTNLLFALLLPFVRKLTFVRYYFLGAAILAIICLAGTFTFLPQKMNVAVIPLMLAVAMRGMMIYRKSQPVISIG